MLAVVGQAFNWSSLVGDFVVVVIHPNHGLLLTWVDKKWNYNPNRSATQAVSPTFCHSKVERPPKKQHPVL